MQTHTHHVGCYKETKLLCEISSMLSCSGNEQLASVFPKVMMQSTSQSLAVDFLAASLVHFQLARGKSNLQLRQNDRKGFQSVPIDFRKFFHNKASLQQPSQLQSTESYPGCWLVSRVKEITAQYATSQRAIQCAQHFVGLLQSVKKLCAAELASSILPHDNLQALLCAKRWRLPINRFNRC